MSRPLTTSILAAALAATSFPLTPPAAAAASADTPVPDSRVPRRSRCQGGAARPRPSARPGRPARRLRGLAEAGPARIGATGCAAGTSRSAVCVELQPRLGPRRHRPSSRCCKRCARRGGGRHRRGRLQLAKFLVLGLGGAAGRGFTALWDRRRRRSTAGRSRWRGTGWFRPARHRADAGAGPCHGRADPARPPRRRTSAPSGAGRRGQRQDQDADGGAGLAHRRPGHAGVPHPRRHLHQPGRPARCGSASGPCSAAAPAPTGSAPSHGLGARQLRHEPEVAGLRYGFDILDAEDSKRLVKRSMTALGLDPRPGADDAGYSPKSLCKAIGRMKDALVLPEQAMAHVEALIAEGARSGMPVDPVGARGRGAGVWEYQRRLREANLADFGDLLLYPTVAMQRDEAYRLRWAGRFDSIACDEYQDVNHGNTPGSCCWARTTGASSLSETMTRACTRSGVVMYGSSAASPATSRKPCRSAWRRTSARRGTSWPPPTP